MTNRERENLNYLEGKIREMKEICNCLHLTLGNDNYAPDIENELNQMLEKIDDKLNLALMQTVVHRCN